MLIEVFMATPDVTQDQIDALRSAFIDSPQCRLAQNAVTRNAIDEVALDHQRATTLDHAVSHRLDDWEVTNQKHSGRCWMFAGLNLFRVGAMKKLNLKEFEFSQNYTFFWDKFERANYFLEAIIETAERPLDDRVVAWLLDHPLDDGGQWNMFVNVVKKYGVVPKSAMPETQSSGNTGKMNAHILAQLRAGSRHLRELHAQGRGVDELRYAKQDVLAAVYRILSIHLGTPPTEFDWQWQDKDKEFHRDGVVTPQEFAERYITLPMDDYVCLVHDPRESSPFGRTYTVQYLGNVVGGESVVTYLNVEIEQMKRIAAETIVGGEPVWFGCDVAPMMQRDLGLWDTQLFDYDTLYHPENGSNGWAKLSKEQRLLHHETFMTHAMLFTGVDMVDNQPRRWRVENSWGEEKSGRKGFFVMSDHWFDEYMFEIAARRETLADDQLAALEEPPIVLPPWDPMGALAR